MFPMGEMLVTPLHYYCKACDVYGRGDECWLCGDSELFFGKHAPSWTHSHHYRLSTRQVSIGDRSVPVRRELRKLIP